MKIRVPVSSGEIIDKITILEIKTARIKDINKLSFVNKELKELSPALKKIFSLNKTDKYKLQSLKKSLFNINTKLWVIEDKLRKLETRKNFNKEFTSLARSVYINNDKRADIKNKINILTGSLIQEVKEYKKYK